MNQISGAQIDLRQALRVFELIKTRGTAEGEEHHFRGLYASSDFDGYTVVLRNEKVTLTIGFHNKYQLDYKDRWALEDFKEKMSAIESLAART